MANGNSVDRCAPSSNPHTPIPAEVRATEFWMLVDRSYWEGCWPWMGRYVNKDGYGEFFDGERMVGAHELALRYSTGEIRHPDLDTCHSCNNPLCCNPRHLRYDTRQSNVDDMTSAGRQARGERNGHAKLTGADVVLIRERAERGATGKALADQYGVQPSAITMILTGKRWAHAGGPIRTTHGTRKAPTP